MEMTRQTRKHLKTIDRIKKLSLLILLLTYINVMFYLWNYNVIYFTHCGIVAMFGLLITNPRNIKRYIPGLSGSTSLRFIAIIVYITFIIAFIGQISIYTYK